MQYFENAGNAGIVLKIVEAIKSNKVYLSDIDGEIGDGDHGINMNKGFSMAEENITIDQSFSEAMKTVGDTLLLEIGGSMGPIYGTFFRVCAKTAKTHAEINATLFSEMLESAMNNVAEIGGAKVGDKTLIDTLHPAVSAFKTEIESGKSFSVALQEAEKAAETGKNSTKEMMAKIGRSARLGERSVGVLDAGATSCHIILKAMFEGVAATIKDK